MPSLPNMQKTPKKTWETLNELTSSSKNKSSKIPSLITPNETITDPTTIAEDFNSFFSQAGQQISDSVPLTNETSESYLPPLMLSHLNEVTLDPFMYLT
jgi:hypothetical protein